MPILTAKYIMVFTHDALQYKASQLKCYLLSYMNENISKT